MSWKVISYMYTREKTREKLWFFYLLFGLPKSAHLSPKSKCFWHHLGIPLGIALVGTFPNCNALHKSMCGGWSNYFLYSHKYLKGSHLLQDLEQMVKILTIAIGL